MFVRFVFAILLGLAVLVGGPLAPQTARADPQADFKKGDTAYQAKDYATAFPLLRKAAEQSYAPAQFLLGIMYDEGQGIAENNREALRWYRKAADQGLVQAQFLLGIAYADGQSVAQDYSEALRWHRKAAEQGFTQAQLHLGLIYFGGIGVAQDLVQAHQWLNIAGAFDRKNAKEVRQNIEKEMTAEQIAEAQRKATQWRRADKKRRK